MKKDISKSEPSKMKANVAYTGRKTRCKFNIKDKSKVNYQHHLVYDTECPSGVFRCKLAATYTKPFL